MLKSVVTYGTHLAYIKRLQAAIIPRKMKIMLHIIYVTLPPHIVNKP